ncbi:MAG: hypothetical protein J6X32_03285, partial [Salinivirgaceae bacterium]|nr:hypothetical protein [Salinivirgaceae bacterium]
VANLVAIPRFGALGAAVVSLATQSLTAIAQIAIAFSIFGLKFCGRTQFKLAAYVLSVAVVGFATIRLPMSWLTNAALMLIAAGCLSVAMGLVRIGDFVKLLKIKDVN